jgi:hypothetical protein
MRGFLWENGQDGFAVAAAALRERGRLAAMADNVVNLNKARKDRDRAQRASDAKQNRARYGQTKADKTKTLTIAEKLKQALDAAKRDRGLDA